MRSPLFDIDNWKEIFATLSRNRTRTFLTAFGIFWGTAMLAMLMGGAKGFQDVIARNFEGFATNSAIFFPGRLSMPYKGYNKGRSWSLTTGDIEAMRKAIPEIDAITCMSGAKSSTKYGKKSRQTSISGVDEYYTRIFLPIIYSGRMINRADNTLERKVCVVGKRVAQELFGDADPIGKYLAVNNIYYRVVGVAGQTSEININDKIDDSVLIPESTLRRAYNHGDKVDAIMMVVRDGDSPTAILPEIERIVRRSHPIHPDDHSAYWFFDVSQQFAMVDNLFTGISLLALFVGAGTLLAGIIGVGNIMWIIVKERTQEIGIRRAIGARPSDIIFQILSEGVVLTAVAGIAGICFAALVLGIVEMAIATPVSTPHFQLTFTKAIYIAATFIILGTVAGLIPAIRSMRIKPIEAMNDR